MLTQAGSSPEYHADSSASVAALKRQAVADWIKGETGLDVPARTESGFRSALKDGVILCQLINAVQPPESDKVIHIAHNDNDGAAEKDKNLKSFLGALEDLEFPEKDTFTISNLTGPTQEDSLEVANSLLKLKSHVGGVNSDLIPSAAAKQEIPITTEASTFQARTPNLSAACTKSESMGFTTKIMDFWTSLLRQRIVSRGVDSESLTNPNVVPCEVFDKFSGMLCSIIAQVEAESCTSVGWEQEQRVSNLEATVEELRAKSSGESTSRTTDSHRSLRGSEREVETLWRRIQAEKEMGAALERQLQHEFGERQVIEKEMDGIRDDLDILSEYLVKAKPIEEENRQLYDTILDLKGKVRVVCRLMDDPKDEPGFVFSNGGDIAVTSGGKRKVFKMNAVVPPGVSDSQACEEAKPLVRSVMDGFSACVFSCGNQTRHGGSSFLGPDGIVSSFLEDILDIQAMRGGQADYRISIKMVTLHNGNAYDLLEEEGCEMFSGTSMQSSASRELNTPHGVEEILSLGTHRSKSLGRGERVVTVVVEGTCLGVDKEFRSYLHLVEIPGSHNQWFESKEVAAVERLLCGIAAGNLREDVLQGNPLTQLLEGALPKDTKAVVMVHLWALGEKSENVMESLKFCARVAKSKDGSESDEVRMVEAEEMVADAQKRCEAKDKEISSLRQEAEEFRLQKERTMAETKKIKQEIQQLKAQLAKTKQSSLKTIPEKKARREPMIPAQAKARTSIPSPQQSTSSMGLDPECSPRSPARATSPSKIPRKQTFGAEGRVSAGKKTVAAMKGSSIKRVTPRSSCADQKSSLKRQQVGRSLA